MEKEKMLVGKRDFERCEGKNSGKLSKRRRKKKRKPKSADFYEGSECELDAESKCGNGLE